MKTGLVLGAGGVVGASWLIGSLKAVEDETGWSPTEADQIVGTSAGSVIGALTAGGVTPELMAAHSLGRLPDAAEAELMAVDRLADDVAGRSTAESYQIALGLPPIGPGSWRMIASTVRNPLRHAPAVVMSAWLPRGFVRTEPIKQLVEGLVPGDWPDGASFWSVACDYATGRRVAFGRDDAPSARVGDAVAASCAIPGFYRPVKINGRCYIDGGVCSPSNLDLVADSGLDLVICLNPTSSEVRARTRNPAERVAALIRGSVGRRLAGEARKVRDRGTEVLLIQPSAADLAVMGVNLMARDRRAIVIETAYESTVRAIRRGGDSLLLPGASAARKRPVESHSRAARAA